MINGCMSHVNNNLSNYVENMLKRRNKSFEEKKNHENNAKERENNVD